MHPNTIRLLVSMLCILSISTISCKKFLATYSQNNSYIESAADLDELLVGEAYYYNQNAGSEMLASMDDDAEMGKVESPNAKLPGSGFFHWQPEPRMDSDGQVSNTDPFFTDLYKRIASINAILHQIPALRNKGEAADTLRRIVGEAHFLRGFYYFLLVNTYGKPYKPATATNDFGVPLKTDVAIKGQFVSRSTTKQVYDQIIVDLLDAEKELAGANQTSTIRANQAAVQSLLSRVYLFIEDYEKAVLYSDKVIKGDSYLVNDLNSHPAGEDFLTRNSREVVFTMGTSNLPSIMQLYTDTPSSAFFRVSDELSASYSLEDLRRQAFFIQSSKGYLKAAKKRKNRNNTIDDVSDKFLIRISEIYLNKAEALAALDRFEEARLSLQELRKNRFKPAALTVITSEGAALMNAIREERRLELCFETHRWFDLRRYGVNTKYPFSKTIRHRSYAFSSTGYQENGYYELKPYEQDAAAYIVPISNDEIIFSNGLLSNEPRPARPLKQ